MLDHLRHHFHVTTRSAEAGFKVCVQIWLCRSSARLLSRHAIHTQPLPYVGEPPTRWRVPSSFIHTMWLFACMLVSAPCTFFSAVKAVPGFLKQSASSAWIVNSTVSFLSGLVTGCGLPFLTASMWELSGRRVHRATLQLVGLLFASILLPCLVTVLCHAECLGGWTRLWQPCTRPSSSFTSYKLR
eukprot:5570313-Amphidinium_carterae.1